MFGRKKMYKKGLADALHANEGFSKKQEEALAYIREEMRRNQKSLAEAINKAEEKFGEHLSGIYDYLSSKEKAELYHLNMPYDIKDLEIDQQHLLLAILNQLAHDEGDAVTAEQQGYIRSIKNYLGIADPQTEAVLTDVENIDSTAVQKVFYQVALEFFYLQDGDELRPAQEEFLEYFSVSKSQAAAIEDHVMRLFNAVGAKGMSEKYGYVPEEETVESESEEEDDPAATNSNQNANSSDSGEFIELKEELADNFMHIWEDRCKVSYCIETAHYCLVLPTSVKSIDKRTGERISFSNLPERIVGVQALGNGTDTVAIEFRKEQGDKTITIVALYDLINDSYTELDCGGSIQLLRAKGNFVVYGDTASHDVFLYNIYTQKIKELPSFDTSRVEAVDIVGDNLYVVVNTSPNLICTVNLTDFSIQKKMKCSLGCDPNNIRVIGSNLLYAEKRSFMFGTSILKIGKVDINSGNLNLFFSSDNCKDKGKLSLHIYDDCFIYRDSPQGSIWIIGTGYDESCKLVRSSSGHAENIVTAMGILWKDSPLDRFPRVGKWVYFTKDGSEKVYKVSIDQPLQTEIVC